MRRSEVEQGLDFFDRAIRARPAESGGYLYRARALAQLGRRNEALLVLAAGERAATDKAAIRAAREEINRMGASL
jgi:hypothetical protein